MEVDLAREPADGEVVVYTIGGGFGVKGTTLEVVERLAAEEWPSFELSESGDKIIIRSSHVLAVRGGGKARRGSIGFTHR